MVYFIEVGHYELLSTGSIPKYPPQYNSMVHSENNLYFLEIGPISDIELTCVFRPVSPLCALYQR